MSEHLRAVFLAETSGRLWHPVYVTNIQTNETRCYEAPDPQIGALYEVGVAELAVEDEELDPIEGWPSLLPVRAVFNNGFVHRQLYRPCTEGS